MSIVLRIQPQTSEDFVWIAHLDDGGVYAEYDGAVARGWASIPPERRVTAIELVPNHPHLHPLRIAIEPEQTAVFFRRRDVRIPLDGAPAAQRTITVIGWESATDARYWAVQSNGDSAVTNEKAAITWPH